MGLTIFSTRPNLWWIKSTWYLFEMKLLAKIIPSTKWNLRITEWSSILRASHISAKIYHFHQYQNHHENHLYDFLYPEYFRNSSPRSFVFPISVGTLSEINPTLCYRTLKFSSMITTFENAKLFSLGYYDMCLSISIYLSLVPRYSSELGTWRSPEKNEKL